MMRSQKELARKLNVSQSTVSRALRNDNSLPLATKVRIKKMADEFGYERRRYACPEPPPESVPRNARLLILIHLAPTMDGKYYTLQLEILQGFIQAAAENHLHLIVKEIENMEMAKSIVAQYSNNTIGAIAMLRYPDEIIDLFCDNFNCISLNHHYDKIKIKVVEPRQEQAFARIYRYLHANGHRKIGFLTVKNSYPFAFSRYAGYLQEASRLGGGDTSRWAINISCSEQLELAEMADRVAAMYREEGVDAFICTSGGLAKNLITELQRRKLRVPEDISIAAFDDVLTPMSSGLLLCGAQANYERMAQQAIKILQEPNAFAETAVVACETDFHSGNSVALRG